MSEIKEIEQKLEKILSGFLTPNYKLYNDVYLEMLITHLTGKKGGADYSSILQSPFLLDWAEEYLKVLDTSPEVANPHVTSFMLKMVAKIIRNEWCLVAVRERELADKINIFLQKQDSLTPAVKLGHVQFLASVAQHSFGLSWIKKTGAWHAIIDYCQKNQTVYVVRESMALIYEILLKFSTKFKDENLCMEILKEIVKPISDNVFNQETGTVCVDNIDLQRTISPTLNLVSYILQQTIENESRTKIAHYLETEFNLEINLWKLADMTQNQHFLGKILKAQTCLNYAKLFHEQLLNKEVSSFDFHHFGLKFFNLMKFCLLRKSSSNVLMLAELNHILWKKLGNRVPEELVIENERIKFENQLITFHILPLFYIFKNQNLGKTELLDNYVMKLLSISCEFTLRISYTFRDLLVESPDSVGDLAYKSIHGILSVEKILDQDRAVLIFQAMVYALKEFAPEGCMYEEYNPGADSDLIVKIPNLLSAVLVGLHTLIEKYRITWKESIESTNLLNFMLVLLRNPYLTSRLAVQSIKLTQLSIEHFLSPNLALLVDNLNGSGMEHLGPMILKRLHDNAWEVRDSTLELVTSIVCISRLKFPAFQAHLLENGICPVVVSMAKHDTEPYVRASAIKCLNQMILINAIWEQNLSSIDLMNHILITLCVETESIVRREAALLVSGIYEHRKICAVHLDTVFSTMAHCAVNDLDWEVKINSLFFWKQVICRQFTHQGMIDGTFPTVTFSKEKKKIVTLNEKEIMLRIQAALDELSLRGCLGVLLKCLEDDCDLEVVKTTVKIIQQLLQFLNKYDYLNVLETLSESGNSSNTTGVEGDGLNGKLLLIRSDVRDVATPPSTNFDESDNVIESIVSAQDINLLVTAYENQMQVDTDPMSVNDKIDQNLYQEFAQIKPKEFLEYIKNTNLDLMIQEKTNWIMNTESLQSLLDDMLFSIKVLDVNDADCY